MRRTALGLLLALAFLPTSSGSHCSSWWSAQPELDTAVLPDVVMEERYYVDLCLSPCQLVWPYYYVLYEETNRREGLQRADQQMVTTCHGMVDPDRYLMP